MGDTVPEVFVAVFDDPARAARVRGELEAAEDGAIALVAAAHVARDAGGRAEWSVRGPGLGHICARADTIAVMLGVDLPAPLVVAGLAAASDDDEEDGGPARAFCEAFMGELAGAVGPEGSVFIGIVEDRWAPQVARGLRGYDRLARRHP